jgi:hypothetical protein
MAPASNIIVRARPGALCLGNAILAQNHGEHQDSNGGIQYGSQGGKVLWASQKGVSVPYIGIPLIRGNQVLVPINGLLGRLQIASVFSNGFLVLPPNFGLAVTDSSILVVTANGQARTNQNPYGFYGGGLPITVQIYPNSTSHVLITFTNGAPNGSNLLLWNASASTAGGLSSLADSDTHNSVRTYQWLGTGSGQSPFCNLPGPASLSQPVSNGAYITTRQAVQPCAIPIAQG